MEEFSRRDAEPRRGGFEVWKFRAGAHAEARNRPLRVGATHREATKPSEASAERGRERRGVGVGELELEFGVGMYDLRMNASPFNPIFQIPPCTSTPNFAIICIDASRWAGVISMRGMLLALSDGSNPATYAL